MGCVQVVDWRSSRGRILLKFGQLVRDFKGFILNGRIVQLSSGLVRIAARTDLQFWGCDIVGVIETPYLIPTEATKLESERKCGCVHVFSHSEMVPFK
ncbi:hypothetical protein OROGR_033106 [Orobanche gracilis]